MTKKFIIYSPEYDENSGGIIALHRLCDLLNREGMQAYMWPPHKPVFSMKHFFVSIRRFVGYSLIGRSIPYQTYDQFNTPIASYFDLKDAVVLYPEYISGNPLNCKNVVRWFLNKPGYFSKKVEYGQNELYFYYAESFNDKSLNPYNYQLQVSYFMGTIYKQTNFGERSGSCYILRKGKNRVLVHDIKGSILIDGLSHQEIANIFNSVETCISYDLYTMYSLYAAICGCISIVIPQENISKDEWHKSHEGNRLGIAYGFDDINHAIKTRHQALPNLLEREKATNLSIKTFVEKCTEFFI